MSHIPLVVVLERSSQECEERSRRRVTVFGNHCFVAIDTQETWFKARLECENLGGQLARVDSQQLQDTLHVSLSSKFPSTYYMGARKDVWMWNNGKHLFC